MTITTREFNRCVDMLGTREDAAKAIGISLRTLQRIMAGSYEVSPQNQAALAKALLAQGQKCITRAQQLMQDQPAAS